MNKNHSWMICALLLVLFASACSAPVADQATTAHSEPVNAEEELRQAIDALSNDIMEGNIHALQDAHLDSEKFTKFGPRNFVRQDVTSTNESEAEFFSSISEAHYEARDLKIDIFGDIGIVTYYPHVSFVRDGEQVAGSGRQTLVFLKTDAGWKIVHEHGTSKPE